MHNKTTLAVHIAPATTRRTNPKVFLFFDLDWTLIIHPADLMKIIYDENENLPVVHYLRRLLKIDLSLIDIAKITIADLYPVLSDNFDTFFDEQTFLFILHKQVSGAFFKIMRSKAMMDRVEVCFLTHGSYSKSTILGALERAWGFPANTLQNVNFFNSYDLGGPRISKGDKIKQLEGKLFTCEDDQIILVDDMLQNCLSAKEHGYWTIQASAECANFMHQTTLLINELLLGFDYEVEAIKQKQKEARAKLNFIN